MATIMYTLPHIELEEVCTAQLCNEDGQGLFVGAVQHQSRDEVVVPAGHEGEDGLHGKGRLHDGQHDLIKGIELACAVDAGGLHDLHGQGSVQILLHEEEHRGRCDAGKDQRDKAVFQAHFGDELQKAQSRHLRGHGHDEQDDGKGGFFEVDNTAAVQHGVQSITVDGKALAGNVLPLAAAGTTVQVQVTMG